MTFDFENDVRAGFYVNLGNHTHEISYQTIVIIRSNRKPARTSGKIVWAGFYVNLGNHTHEISYQTIVIIRSNRKPARTFGFGVFSNYFFEPLTYFTL